MSLKYMPEFDCYDEDTGTERDRLLAVICNAIESKNPVTRHNSQEILADKLMKALKITVEIPDE